MAQIVGQDLPAVERVREINELLGRIIFMMPPPRILTSAMRVSKKWKAVIDRTPEIQRKLHLKSVSAVVQPTMPLHCTAIYQWAIRINPIILDVVTGSGTVRDVRAGIYPHRSRATDHGDNMLTLRFDRSGQPPDCLPPPFTAWNNPQASWKTMFFTHPPCSLVVLTYSSSTPRTYGDAAIRDPAGVRFNQVEKVTKQMISTIRRYGCEADIRFESDIVISVHFWSRW